MLGLPSGSFEGRHDEVDVPGRVVEDGLEDALTVDPLTAWRACGCRSARVSDAC